jgi:hypothetical protein
MAALKKSLGDEKKGKTAAKKAPAKRETAKKETKEPARKRA